MVQSQVDDQPPKLEAQASQLSHTVLLYLKPFLVALQRCYISSKGRSHKSFPYPQGALTPCCRLFCRVCNTRTEGAHILAFVHHILAFVHPLLTKAIVKPHAFGWALKLAARPFSDVLDRERT